MSDSDGYFGAEVAARYDDVHSPMFELTTVTATVDVLARLAGDSAVLELGIGTGRIALPLAERGVSVHGIELSQAMVDQLRAKPGGEAIPVTVGDFATTRVDAPPGGFGLAYLVFNTINNLTSQDDQVACFRTTAEHLAPGGRFVVEVGVPELRRLPYGETTVMWGEGPPVWSYDVYDTATQALSSNYVRIDDGHATFRSIPFRYVWPAELDLMARLAGLRLRSRWEDWDERPFTHESRRHVSVWEKPTEGHVERTTGIEPA
ncbi:class I SAM-dependent DNA methyltransferase [Mumia quercus]|uniref:class I SAM-dependent DNA methyltransferase n=1 Tax=Mumia quercus TaxID=2976125 RepID=UPI0021D11401|nr:class I SAM-dependent methyltransferase [Mumia quercus]